MGAKKEALILKALEERKRYAGRHLLPDAHDAAAALIGYLRERAPQATITAVGSLRRGCDTCGDLDLLASGADRSLMDDFVGYPRVERVLGRGDTKSSVLLSGGFQADLRLVPPRKPRRRAAVLHRIEGAQHRAAGSCDRPRVEAERIRRVQNGRWTTATGYASPASTEEDVYAALGLDWIPPELREMHGEIEAAQAKTLPRLIDRADLRGDLHMHTTETDGKDDLRAMAEAAREAGLEYVAITDHSKSLAMANGLDEHRALAHAARIRALDAEGIGVRLLAGIECDIKPDGSLDLADDCLAALDLVVASVHSAFNQDHQQMTDRLLRAIENPHVDILGHPTGRRILQREPYPFDVVDGHRRGRRAGRRARNQLPGAPAGPERRPREARARSRRAARDLERRALTRGRRRARLGSRGGPARVARAGARRSTRGRSTTFGTACGGTDA